MSHKKMPFVLAVASMALLASCGGTPSEPTLSNSSESKEEDTSATAPIESESSTTVTDEEFDPSKPVTINFWHTMGKTPGQEVLNSMIARFNEIYPNITVEHSQQGGYDELHSTINENLATGNLPTMAYCYEDHVASYIDHNAVLDMTPYVEDPVYGLGHNPAGYDLGDLGVEDMTPSYWVPGAAYAVEGRYSFPFSKSTEALFYNKSIFDANGWEAPKTWDEMWDICEQIRSMPEYANNDDFYCLGYDSDANLVIGGFEQRGLPYTSLEVNASGSHFNFNTAENKAYVSELKSHYDNHYLVTKGSSSNSSYTSELFKAGTCLMSIGSTGGTSYNYTDNFEVGVAGVPQEDVNDPKMLSPRARPSASSSAEPPRLSAPLPGSSTSSSPTPTIPPILPTVLAITRSATPLIRASSSPMKSRPRPALPASSATSSTTSAMRTTAISPASSLPRLSRDPRSPASRWMASLPPSCSAPRPSTKPSTTRWPTASSPNKTHIC